ncbi:conserved hypothetical protein [Leishmania mexicana MHOM/GT/2001/U1103]|uniref:Uncharacterized protein n=1 Tax=Leishmania mexicana (strain MHOM/GT/2001/U1103) TaxID=929439 RepID=E9ALM6_LEIMU|nr:conserved hypothetical protein [Leishmania mexicana MHOM/GT/2001/U1103]CBZ23831.1 conserved hypothetical protein [Leishmania mexicana MHOM/GT/2001/U1103]
MNASLRSERRGRSRTGVVGATESASQIHTAQLLGRSNELLHASRAFSAWAAAIRQRRLQTHLKRCSTMLKHNSLRQEYTRCFMRWLAFTQMRTSENVRSAIRLRQDVPLRSKADFLALARRYFAKWRAHVRRRKQRTVTNVELLEALNKERLRSRRLLKWWRFHNVQTRKHCATGIAEREDANRKLQQELQKAVHETKALRDQLHAARQQQSELQNDLEISRGDIGASEQQRQREVDELREAIQQAVKLLDGPSSLRLRSLHKWSIVAANPCSPSGVSKPRPPSPETLLKSARQSKDTAEALLCAVGDTLASLSLIAKMPKPPASFEECAAHLHERLREETEATTIKAQRDELASAAQTARASLAAASSLLQMVSPADSDWESSHGPSLTTSRLGDGPNKSGLHSVLRNTGGGQRSGAAVVNFDRPSSVAPGVRKETPPSIRPPASPADTTFIDYQKLPRLLVEDAKAAFGAIQAMRQDGRRSSDEVVNLQGAALRALDAFGGRGATNTNFMAKPKESVEERASRSANIADSLRTLCENMDAVLVLTSLWSGKGASEKVSVALERLWHRTQDLEAAHADDLQHMAQYAAVVHTSVAILRPPPATPPSTMSQRTAALLARRQQKAPPDDVVATPQQVEVARRSAGHLATKGDRKPTELIELCLQAQQRAAAEQPSLPTNEFDGLAKSAHEIIEVAIGKSRCGEKGVRFSAAPSSRPGRSRVAPETSNSAAGGAEASRSGSMHPSTAEAVAKALTAAAAVAAEALSSSDGVVDNSLVDAIVRARGQVRQLQEQLKDLALSELQNEEAKKRLQAELKETVTRNKVSERARKKYVDDFDKGRSVAERDLQRQLRELQREAAQSAQVCRSLEKDRRELEEGNKAKDVALQSQTEATHRLSEEVESLRRQLAAAESENSMSGEKREVLRRHLDDLQRQRADYDAAVAELETQLCSAHDAIETAAVAHHELARQLSDVEEANRRNNAMSVFLRDVLRDCLTRLHHLTHNWSAAAAWERSLTLQQAPDRPPPILTRGSDPSDYVEYLLQLDGNDTMGKLLVQQHLRENMAVQRLRELSVDGGVAGAPRSGSAATPVGHSVRFDGADPSTWEVVAELHNRLVLLYDLIADVDDSAVEQRARIGTLTVVKGQPRADVLKALVELKPWSSAAAVAAHTEHHVAPRSSEDGAESSPHGHALRISCAEVAQALEEMEKVAARTRPLMEMRSSGSPLRRANVKGPLDMPSTDGAATKRLLSLVADVQDMAHCLQHLSESVIHAIVALGGTPDEGEANMSNIMERRDSASSPMAAAATESTAVKRHTQAGAQTGCVDSRMLATRLEAICKETGTSVQELKQLLGVRDGVSGASCESSTKGIDKPLKLRDLLPFTRTKMQELQEVKQESERILTGLNHAFSDDDSLSTASSTQRSLKRKRKPLPALQCTPEKGLRLMQQEMEGRVKTSRRPGDYASLLQDPKVTVRERIGDLQNLRFTCCSILQVLEGRLVKGDEAEKPPKYGESLMAMLTSQLVDLKQVLPETEEALAGYRSTLLNVTVGTRLHMLCGVVRSLKLERDSLKEDLARCSLQGHMLLSDFSEETKALRAMIARREEEQARHASEMASASGETDAQKCNVAKLTAKLTSFEHERNLLCDALVHTLRNLPGTPYRRVPLVGMQRNLLAALKEQGELLTAYVEAALQRANAHQQHLQDILHGSLSELRCDMAALRAEVTNSWDIYGRHMASAAVQQLVETAEVLTLENNMLRPRAIEREQLKLEKADLEAALADAEAARADVLARLEHAEDENTQLRRAVRDAQIAQALTNGDDDDQAGDRRSRSGEKVPRTHSVDWERRMIKGATGLSMDMVDSMSGTSMSSVFGSVVEETLRIYAGVRHSLREMVAACEAARGKDNCHVRIAVEEQLHELRELAESADFLRSRLPVLYRVPYQ